jgi:hypothetical protein
MAIPSSPSIIRTANPWCGVLILALVTAFFAAITGLATLNLRGFGDDRGAMFWLLAAFWSAVLALAYWTIKVAVHAWRYRRSTIRLDAAPLHLGDWASGVVEGPTGLDRSVIQLSVVCVETFSRFKPHAHERWQHLTLLDGARLNREGHCVLVPFAALLPAGGRASERDSQHHARLEWLLRIRAHGPRVNYEVSVGIPVLPAVAGATRASTTAPREIPELPVDDSRRGSPPSSSASAMPS